MLVGESGSLDSRSVLRDAVGLTLAIRHADWGGFNELARRYRLDDEQRALVHTAIALLALEPDADLESFALYLAGKP